MAEGVGKRQRKSTEFFNPVTEKKEPVTLVGQKGAGEKLGDIPNFVYRLHSVPATDELVEFLHQILYKVKGKTSVRKKEIREFSGFTFPEEETEAELRRVESRLLSRTLAQLHSLLDLLELPRGSAETGTKESKVSRIIEYLKAPKKMSDTDLAEKAAKKREEAAKKKQKAEEQKERKLKAKEKAVAKQGKGIAKKTAPKAKSTSTPAKKTKKAAAEEASIGKGAKRKTPAKDAKEKPAKKAKKTDEDGKEADDTPASKWPPAKQVKQDVEAILEAAVEAGKDVSMTDVYTGLGDKYGLTLEEVKTHKMSIKRAVDKYRKKEGDSPATKDKELKHVPEGVEKPEKELKPEDDPEATTAVDDATHDAPASTADAAEKPAEEAEADAKEADAAEDTLAPENADAEESEEPLIKEPATTEGDEYVPEAMKTDAPTAEEPSPPNEESPAATKETPAAPAESAPPAESAQPVGEIAAPTQGAVEPESSFADLADIDNL